MERQVDREHSGQEEKHSSDKPVPYQFRLWVWMKSLFWIFSNQITCESSLSPEELHPISGVLELFNNHSYQEGSLKGPSPFLPITQAFEFI